jgi:hypothetical protein
MEEDVGVQFFMLRKIRTVRTLASIREVYASQKQVPYVLRTRPITCGEWDRKTDVVLAAVVCVATRLVQVPSLVIL